MDLLVIGNTEERRIVVVVGSVEALLKPEEIFADPDVSASNAIASHLVNQGYTDFSILEVGHTLIFPSERYHNIIIDGINEGVEQLKQNLDSPQDLVPKLEAQIDFLVDLDNPPEELARGLGITILTRKLIRDVQETLPDVDEKQPQKLN